MNSRHILYSRAEADAAQDAAPSAHAAELQRIAGQLEDLCQALESCRILRRDCERAASDLCARALPFGGWCGQALAKANFCRSYFDHDDDTACYELGPQTGGERRRPAPLPADPSIADILAASDERDRWERERPAREERRLAGLLRNMADQLRREAAASAAAGARTPPADSSTDRRESNPKTRRGFLRLAETSVKDQKIVAALQAGQSYRQVAEALGVGKSTVARVAQAYEMTGERPEAVPLDGTLSENLSIRERSGKRQAE